MSLSWLTWLSWKSASLLAVLFFFAVPAFSQNTKGDSPVGNQRTIRETKMKSIKRKDRSTKDISGHRLRTKNQSSASRANASYPTPSPYANRKRIKSDRASKASPTYTARPPSERQRPWSGDISGKPLRIVARNKKLARNSLYPSRVYTRTATGQLPIRKRPQEQQRAWKGGIDRGPIKNQTATGRIKNVYPQNGRYATYSKKRLATKEGSVSNRAVLGLTSRLSSRPPGIRRGAGYRSASSNFVKRGKRNVYWGKVSKGETAVTRDLTGRPVRTRNFRSTPAGLVGRDSIKFFGRKPIGDRANRSMSGGYATASKRGQRAWQGDISGQKLRNTNPKRNTETAGNPLFPRRLSISRTGEAGRQLPDGGYASKSRQRVGNQPLPPKAPGIGATGIGNYKGNRSFRPGFGTQGAGYSGAAKTRRQAKGGGSISGKLWNNGQTPVGVRTPGQVGAGNFQGNIPAQAGRDYREQGEGFTGFTKARRPAKGGGSISGKLWNNGQTPVGVRTPGQVAAGSFQGNIPAQAGRDYREQGEGFTGFTKVRRPVEGGGSISGKLWNNGGSPVSARTPGESYFRAGNFQGNIPSQRGRDYRDQGEGFAGYTKAKRPVKGGGSITTKWNNNESPIGVRTPGQGSIRAGSFQGNIPAERGRDYRDQGEGFAGYIKAKKQVKGGGSITTQWNNNETPIGVRTPGQGSIKAGNYSGNIKATKIPKGGGSISGHWNNNESPIDVRMPGAGSMKAGSYTGTIKATKTPKGGGSISGKLWNNNELPIEVRTPAKGAIAMGYSGRMKSDGYVQNPNAAKASTLKQRPDKTTYAVAGLQTKVKEGNYKEKPNAAKGSLPGVAPTRSSVRASEYAGNLKLYWDYKQNPSSADGAQKALYFGKAYARIGDYQGNIKMHKYNDRRLHPDAQFAHNFQDNVKGEKTVMTDLKLLWAKVFNKNDTQPENLKEKSERPRYDKSEKGLWIDDPSFEKKKKAEQ